MIYVTQTLLPTCWVSCMEPVYGKVDPIHAMEAEGGDPGAELAALRQELEQEKADHRRTARDLGRAVEQCMFNESVQQVPKSKEGGGGYRKRKSTKKRRKKTRRRRR